jgi:hypothetical protein
MYNEPFFPVSPADLASLLHRSIGALTFLNKKMQICAGTGTLISRDLVLTVAHNIFDKAGSVRIKAKSNK